MTIQASLAGYLQANDEVMSRTAAKGTASTSVSLHKLPSLLTGVELTERVDANRRSATAHIVWRARTGTSAKSTIALELITLGEIVNAGISGGGIFRKWDVPYGSSASVPWQSVPKALLSGQFANGIDALGSGDGALRFVGGLEWEIGIGPLHPFYDGCGRVSRYLSALLCLRHQIPLVSRISREAYFEAGRRGKSDFQQYFASLPRTNTDLLAHDT
jgi:hypothetical protein